MLVRLQTAFRKIKSCSTLQAIQFVLDSDMQTLSLQMSGAGFDVSFNKADQVYGVQVQPMEGEILNKRPVFLS